jgi:hypothetical protein
MTYGSDKNIMECAELFLNDPKLIIPVLSDHKAHWCINRISFSYIFNIRTHQELMLGFNHNDLYRLNLNSLEPFIGTNTFVLKKKYLYEFPKWESLLDIEMIHWYFTNEKFSFEIDSTVKQYYADFRDLPNVNDFIPIMRHLETCRSVKDMIINQITNLTISDSLIKYQKTLDNLTQIESQGLYVDTSK